ncbi:MAG TPA: hypothetical protein PKX31_00280 [Chitinophagaceae bacterium]|nr:hypothetical protein [Chitinophagaceae bacterium]
MNWVLELFVEDFDNIDRVVIDCGTFEDIFPQFRDLKTKYKGEEFEQLFLGRTSFVFYIKGNGFWGDERGFRFYQLKEMNVEEYIKKEPRS